MLGVFGIGSAARLLRVPPATIRTWERRYGVVVPQRTAGGHRVYSHEQVEQLRFIATCLSQGMRPAEAHRLLVEGAALPGERTVELELPATASAPRAARSAVEQIVGDQCDSIRFKLRLLVSELVANSVRHADDAESALVRVVAVRKPDVVQVRVIDHGQGFDWARRSDGEGGRGLPLVAALATRWGLTFERGTIAWFELALGSRSAGATLDA